MNRDEWLPSIRANPQEWLASIIGGGELDLALELIRDNPDLLKARLPGHRSALSAAAYFEQHDIAEALLAAGAHMDFLSAVMLGRARAVAMMADENPTLLTRRSWDGITALHWASRNAGPDMVELFLSAGIDVDDHRNNKRVSPLFFWNKEPFGNAELLLARGAAINRRSASGFTVLHCAALAGDADRVRFLLAHGADPEMQTNARQTPWALAVRHGHRSVAAVLSSRYLGLWSARHCDPG